MTHLDEDDLVRRAINHFTRECREEGGDAPYPSAASGFTDDTTIELVNCNGTLARYRVTPARKLRRLPEAIEDGDGATAITIASFQKTEDVGDEGDVLLNFTDGTEEFLTYTLLEIEKGTLTVTNQDELDAAQEALEEVHDERSNDAWKAAMLLNTWGDGVTSEDIAGTCQLRLNEAKNDFACMVEKDKLDPTQLARIVYVFVELERLMLQAGLVDEFQKTRDFQAAAAASLAAHMAAE